MSEIAYDDVQQELMSLWEAYETGKTSYIELKHNVLRLQRELPHPYRPDVKGLLALWEDYETGQASLTQVKDKVLHLGPEPARLTQEELDALAATEPTATLQYGKPPRSVYVSPRHVHQRANAANVETAQAEGQGRAAMRGVRRRDGKDNGIDPTDGL